ncbi:MAG TPA: CPBP family intramembrane glutamic endopeptidase [Chthoniobacterales bacterium]|nr:CPBP family intramembrane glutamic endopeptidase [Chthoniobacterales bacterium]
MTTDPPVDPSLPPPPQQINRRGWWIHLILIGGYFAAVIPFAAFGQPRRPTLFTNSQSLLLVSAFEFIFFSVVFGLAWLASRASVDDLLLRWRQGWWTVLLGIAYSIAMRLALGLLVVAIVAVLLATRIVNSESIETFSRNAQTPVERLVDVSAMQHDSAYFWLTITVASFGVAGLREELWRSGTLAAMRKLWPNRFGDRTGQVTAVAIVAIVFGLAHLSLGVIAAAMAFILGLLLGLIMVVHKSIWPAVIAHGTFDATSFALIPFALQQLQRVH